MKPTMSSFSNCTPRVALIILLSSNLRVSRSAIACPEARNMIQCRRVGSCEWMSGRCHTMEDCHANGLCMTTDADNRLAGMLCGSQNCKTDCNEFHVLHANDAPGVQCYWMDQPTQQPTEDPLSFPP